MKRMLVMSVFMGLVSGCAAKTLDVGGTADGGGSGGPGEPGPGTHSTVVLPHVGETTGLVSEGAYLYWLKRDPIMSNAAGVIRRCEKHDCAATEQDVVSGPFGMALIVVRNETLYFALQDSIVSCPVSDCSAPTVIVAHGGKWPRVVDDSHVYWITGADSAFLSCPLTGCERATAAPVTGIGSGLGWGDGDKLYWLSQPGPSDVAIKSAPKDGSALPTVVASGLSSPSPLVFDGGFVYWSSLETRGTIERCPTSGCTGGVPEVLLDKQYYPHSLTVIDGVVFWLNETDPPEKLIAINRPASLLGCVAANCAETVEVLDEARGGSLFDPINTIGWSRPQDMVADSEAVYWIGDVSDRAPSGSKDPIIDTSIRKWTRKPGK